MHSPFRLREGIKKEPVPVFCWDRNRFPAVPPGLAHCAHFCVPTYADFRNGEPLRRPYFAFAFPIALGSPFDPAAFAALTPAAARWLRSGGVYSLFLNGLVYYIPHGEICQEEMRFSLHRRPSRCPERITGGLGSATSQGVWGTSFRFSFSIMLLLETTQSFKFRFSEQLPKTHVILSERSESKDPLRYCGIS